jgi:2-haloacid dehalogenase
MSDASERDAVRRRFEALCVAHSADLSRFVYWLCHDRNLAEDVVQETLLRAWRSLDSLRDEGAARSWLLTIARRELARVFERRKVATVALEHAVDLSSAETTVGDDYDAHVMRRAIFELELLYREPLLLQMLFGYSVEEIAAQLQLTVPAVLTRLHRARQLLHQRLRPDVVTRGDADQKSRFGVTRMTLTRRRFLGASIATAAVAASNAPPAARPSAHDIAAVAFDAFALFDPRPVFQACEAVAPGKGNELASLWRARQFEYQWLRGLGQRYEDFYDATAAALEFAAQSLKLDLAAAAREQLMHGFLELRAWPDVAESLRILRRAGRKLALVSNATPRILTSALRNSGLETALDEVISTDRIRSYKPDPRAYQLCVDVLKLPKERIAFVAFAGWDVAGAKWFGYPTFWNNRQSAPPEILGVKADAEGATLGELLQWLDLPSPAT